jgi:hypothetical protein
VCSAFIRHAKGRTSTFQTNYISLNEYFTHTSLPHEVIMAKGHGISVLMTRFATFVY